MRIRYFLKIRKIKTRSWSIRVETHEWEASKWTATTTRTTFSFENETDPEKSKAVANINNYIFSRFGCFLFLFCFLFYLIFKYCFLILLFLKININLKLYHQSNFFVLIRFILFIFRVWSLEKKLLVKFSQFTKLYQTIKDNNITSKDQSEYMGYK